MTKKKYRRYSPEFKRHVLKRASEDGTTDKGVCEDLGISARQSGLRPVLHRPVESATQSGPSRI